MTREMILRLGLTLILAGCLVEGKPIDETLKAALTDGDGEIEGLSDENVLVELDIVWPREGYGEWMDKWPGLTIPYQIAVDGFDSVGLLNVLLAMEEWERYTCMRFQPRDVEHDRDYVRIMSGSGCWSAVGRCGGQQNLSLGDGCQDAVTPRHELGHAIGLFHEQSRPDRDDYVTIHEENIVQAVRESFDYYTWWDINMYDVPYDYTSIMHYGKDYWKIANAPGVTIETLDAEYTDIIGTAEHASFRDVEIVNKMYECANRCEKRDSYCKNQFGSEAFLGKDCTCWTMENFREKGERTNYDKAGLMLAVLFSSEDLQQLPSVLPNFFE